ncbi:phage holin family protein [Peptacetobacter hiranonis]|uniref:Toxin secretion/phage lysis holin n=2 Tax=Peptacetobacter TaxID=2743582 RepID=B6G020_PEPHT|nr:phage holin family protein [Peptacetobacter hiranonis]EEA84848.1 toxin secretion/phage lysis holin [Peptacetobacter hiranonis DSM 13275]QEK20746.1 hypothetical protein KGNDJEFE_01233 [Peptacetobacter hiranonis]
MTRMTNFLNNFNGGIAVLGTWFTWLFGGWDLALKSLVLLMCVDYITGLVKGYLNKNLNSLTSFRGICKKLFILLILIVAVILDRVIGNDGYIFRTLVCFFYIANESLSVVENASELGVPIPKSIKVALEQLKEEND